MDSSTALSIYRQEKERALQERRISHSQLMAEAKEAFAKMLADAQLARKGGRPRTNPVPPAGVKAAAPAPVPVKKPEKPVKAKARVARPAKAAAKKAPAAKARPAAKRSGSLHAKAAAKAHGGKTAARATRHNGRGKASKKR